MTIITAKSSWFANAKLFAASVAALGFLGAAGLQAASIPEPATIFYGRILDINSGYQVMEGDLTWIVRRSDGVNQVLRTSVQPLDGGKMSYWLDVPHNALALGLDGSSSSVPLRGVDDTHKHLLIAVDGRAAVIIGPNGSAFDAGQARRTATYRLDLAVSVNGFDSDGNGLPDWWKNKYGVTDASADPDGDGLNNLAEYRAGYDPKHNDRAPTLATRELRAYAEGTTVLRLRSIDADSGPTNLVYTITSVPDAGALYLRNASSSGNHDVLLEANSGFSQADVNSGRVVFLHQGGDASALETGFELVLRDEDPAHAASTNSVAITLYKPGKAVPAGAIPATASAVALRIRDISGFASEEQALVTTYFLSRDLGHVVVDASGEVINSDLAAPSAAVTRSQYSSQFVPSFGADRPHVMLGGFGKDRLAGSMEKDVLLGGRGNDTLRGNAGADVYLITTREDGNDTIEDFTASEGDAIDISRVLNGTSTLLTDYVRITSTSSNSAIGINFNGTGTTYDNMVLTLAGTQLSQADLYTLVENGNLITGSISLPSRVSIAATTPTASENGPTAGEFTLTRTGSVDSSLTVGLQITGSAANGVDYQYVSSSATFAAGQATTTVRITPYSDAVTELSEMVDFSVVAGTGYVVGTPSSAQLSIQDLMPEISIEAVESTAVKNEQLPGLFLVSRSGVLDRSVFVRLQISGTASNGVDYTRINSFLNLQSAQTSDLIQITPLQTASLQAGKSVQVTIKPDATYRVGSSPTARVMLVEEMMSFVQWRARYFPAATNSMSAFANQDPGGFGIPNLLRYAYGLDAYAPSRSRMPTASIRDGYLTVDAFHRPDASDLEYQVEVAPNLSSWSSAPNVVEVIPFTLSNDPNMNSYRALPGTSSQPQLFMKLRVIYKP